METQHQPNIDGEPVLPAARQAVPVDDRLYRYVPVPPVGLDEDGYLVEDSKGQNTWHFSQISLWYLQLTHWLPTATVCSNLAMHYGQGDRGATLVPDLFVAQTPPQENRQSYKLWEDPLPELVIEMLSEEDSEDDVGPKQFTYEYLGVREYWLFDPEGFELPEPLIGYRLCEGRYQPIEADAAGLRRSDVLGFDLHVLDRELRFLDPATSENLRTYKEAREEAQAAKQRADAERRKADAAEREWMEEKDKAGAERRRAEAARRRADAAEREIVRLRALLEEQ